MKITSDLNKKAWTIRKQAAAKYACPVMEISWAACLKLAKEEIMATLTGTEKQIAWAEKIRAQKMEDIKDTKKALQTVREQAPAQIDMAMIVLDEYAAETSAAKWIDRRDDKISAFNRKSAFGKWLEAEVAARLAA